MMRNGGLRKVNVGFDVGGAKADVLADRASPALLERLQNFPPGGVGDGMQNPI